ncbi:transposon Tf2-6 polyprotein [Trichonephila clavipes]|nr:transposon Tf2-6 polyprotein [Trichonephila clavipes]
MEEKQNCIQTPVNKGTAQFCYKKQKMESYIPFTTCRKRQIQQKKKDYAKKELITRIARWALQLEVFDYEIEHRAGNRMKHVDALSRYLKTFGNPIRIISDRGSAFTSKLFNDYCDEENIQHLQISTGVPRRNGRVQRIHRTLIPVLTKLSLDDSTKWYKYVDRLQRILNSTISRSTKWTPFELLVGIKMRNKEDILIKDLLLEEMAKELLEQREFLRNDAKKNIETLQFENRKTYNRRRKKASLYKENDLVAIQRTQFGAGLKLRPKFLGPYKVTMKWKRIAKPEKKNLRIEEQKEKNYALKSKKKKLRIEEREEKLRFEQLRLDEQKRKDEFELEKLRIQTQSKLGADTSKESDTKFLVKEISKFIHRFDLKEDISLYLKLFERQAQRLNIDQENWVSHLLGLLPTEVSHIIAREPDDKANCYEHVKDLLLKRFKLTPEKFRQLFVTHQKAPERTWIDFYHELNTYFNGWIDGLKIDTFNKLSDLIITDQLKRKTPFEFKEYYLDEWANMNSPVQLAEN